MRLGIRVGVLLLATSTAVAAEPMQRTLTFEDRVKAQKAIEQVYWSHRIWPKENPGPKPPLSAVMSDETIQAKVGKYLRKSNALDSWWHRPITSDNLQAELDRMARQTRDSAMLQEIFHALHDDPYLIAETFARQTLADRLIRSWYGSDMRVHGAQRARVGMSVGACANVGCLRSVGGEYRETRWELRTEQRPPSAQTNTAEILLDPDEWKDHIAHLASELGATTISLPIGKLGAIQETADAFVITALLEQTNTRVVTASVTWPKRTFDAWWEIARRADTTDVEQASGLLTLPQILPRVCTDDTWSTTYSFELRNGPSAVWTGSEMIVWGGGTDTGVRYSPASDSWTRTSIGQNVPDARFGHTAVWTGMEMIVWGGSPPPGNSYLNTGGRYDPSTDTWMPTSVGMNVPTARSYSSGIWTGTQMIVWGGISDFGYLKTGGRYTPSTNTWEPTSVGANVPIARYFHGVVWTGAQMIIWGGYPYVNSGGRYDPSSDSWTPTSVGANVPAGRRALTAVWTGNEMIVWGGDNGSYLNTGGRYNPATDSWLAMSVGTNVPAARAYHNAVWSGTRMIVWGGTYDRTGGRYDPASDSWTPTSVLNAPVGRQGSNAVWTGTEMIIWGGHDSNGGLFNGGGRYRPDIDSWTPTSTMNVPTARYAHNAVWTGAEMVVWGGSATGSLVNSGGRYDPVSDAWTPTSVGANVPSARYRATAVWTGTEMIVWGGAFESGSTTYLNTGGRYNPASDFWTPTSLLNAPTGRIAHTAVFAGTAMIVWGGFDGSAYVNTGGRYNNSTDTWASTSAGTNVPLARGGHSAVWTGNELIVWGGAYYNVNNVYLNTGARYSPSTDSWVPTSMGPNVPAPRAGHTASWTGSEMIAWGGQNGSNLNSGGAYTPSADTWRSTSVGTNVPSARTAHTGIWTGSEMIVWGGRGLYGYKANTGGRYNPVTDSWKSTSVGDNVPLPRESLSSVWTGIQMIVWGGLGDSSINSRLDSGGLYCVCPSRRTFYRDLDGDGYGNPGNSVDSCFDTIPPGYVDNGSDCDDTNASMYPGAPEINDGIDNQCPGDPGYGSIDELGDSGSVADDKATFSWAVQPNATSYQMARASTPDFTIACTSFNGSSPTFQDAETPPSGTEFYYIARPTAPFVGSWGKTSAGTERTTSCP